MKTKTVLILTACLLAAAFVLGVSGAVPLARAEEGADTALAEADRLVGIFITTEYLDLFDAEGYFSDHADEILSGAAVDEDAAESYAGRLYATLQSVSHPDAQTGEVRTSDEYVFGDAAGMAYLVVRLTDAQGAYSASYGDEAISDGHISISETDDGSSLSLEGTIYVSTSAGSVTFYFNPVYQTAAGEVYAVCGDGMSFDGGQAAGMSCSQELKSESSGTLTGTGGSQSSRVQITLCFMDAPTQITVLQMAADHTVLSREAYVPGTLPETLTVQDGTAYLMAETLSAASEAPARTVCQPGDLWLNTFFCRADGICVMQATGLVWGD